MGVIVPRDSKNRRNSDPRYSYGTASLGEYSDIIGKRPGRCTVMQNGAEVKEPARMGGKERRLGCVRSASDMLVRLVRS